MLKLFLKFTFYIHLCTLFILFTFFFSLHRDQTLINVAQNKKIMPDVVNTVAL
jgi:hypothetical protein